MPSEGQSLIPLLKYKRPTSSPILTVRRNLITSHGLGGLTAAYNLVEQAGGRITFFAAPERLVRTLQRLRLDRVLEFVEDEASALSSLY